MHLYLHVPFCARKCSYCDFAIAVRREAPDAEYLQAIGREWDAWQRHPALAARAPLRTIYFGGGTPSRLAPETIGALVALVTQDCSLMEGAEVTLEANPDDVTSARADGWVRAGVNRISLGVQSHDPTVLTWMHRTHRAEQVAPAMAMLREAGIANISIDLIFALPPEVPRDWGADLDATFALAPDHISLYGLTVEPHTPLARWTERGVAHEAPAERYADEYLLAHERLTTHGFEHYEVSNAGQPGRRSRHNSAYWSGADYLGLGPSAHSFIGGVRSWNAREWADYQRRIGGGEPVTVGRETITGASAELERLYLGLRTDRGVPSDRIPRSQLTRWLAEGWATEAGATLRLTANGWLRLDALVTQVGRP